MSLHSFIEYLQLEKKYSTHTVTSYQTDLKSFKSFCEEQYELTGIENINYAIIRSWIIKLVNSGVSNRSVNRKIASLKAYYKFLIKINVIEENPLQNHKALKTPKKVETPFSENEMENVLELIPFADNFEGSRDKLMIEFLYTTGMRRSELINLKTTDIDFNTQTVRVLGKRNKERIIPLLDSLVRSIDSYMAYRKQVESVKSDSFLFLLKNGNKIYEMLVYRTINNYFSKASSKLKKSPHILRHTFATHLLAQGADLNSVKELLGHSSLASTQVYTHNSIVELKKAYQKAHPRSKK